MEPETMIKLVRQAKRGNVDAYGQLVEANQEYFYKTAYLFTKNEQMALDIVQECVLKGFRNIHSLKQPEYFQTWMIKILMNSAKTLVGKVIPMQDISQIEIAKDEEGISMEEKWDLYSAINVLPEQYRMVIILKYFNELKLCEIANIMSVPEGTVSAYLTRAKQKLREYLKEGDL